MLYAPQTMPQETVPLVVDLDGTLVRTDLLHESVFALLKRSPFYLFLLPFWLFRGKARLKHEIARRIDLDPATLPYNGPFIEHLREERAHGRSLILATASNHRLAARVADHLGLFDAVLASDERTNLCGEQKLAALRERFGDSEFDYAGNGMADLPIWRSARSATLVAGDRRVTRAVGRGIPLDRHFPRERTSFATYLHALRVHQWLKNLLVFVPAVAALRITEPMVLQQLLVAFLSFSLCASSVYILNDLMDLEDDRRHPRKRNRPFASGDLSIARGCTLIPLLLGGAVGLALLLPPAFLGALALYYATTLAYSFRLKRIEVLDILTLALLYTVRIIGGGAATGIPLTVWLLGFSLFVFLSLAVAKRCAELLVMRERGENGARGRGYRVDDLPLLYSLGVGAGYVATLILVLYLTSSAVEEAYTTPAVLWVLCPMLLYWITRVWLKTYRGEMHDDPVVFAARDPGSRVLAVIGGLAIWLAV